MEGSNEAPHGIENPSIPLATSMRRELHGLTPLSPSCCIYKVPERLRCVNEKAYTPQVVSIGPIHHGKKGLEDMEEHKKRKVELKKKRTLQSPFSLRGESIYSSVSFRRLCMLTVGCCYNLSTVWPILPP